MPPGSSAIAKAGRPYRSFSRAATRPTTPGCQPSAAVTTTAPFSSMPSAAIASASACATRRQLDRLALAVEPVELGGDARGLGSDRPRAAGRRRASARPMRPPALMRGPSRKPRCHGSGGPPSRATSISAVRPTCSRRRIASRPLATKARLSPLSGTTSATVPSATRSSSAEQIGLRPRSRPEAARAQLAVDRHHGHEHEPDRGEMAEPGEIVEPVRIDHRERGRQRLVGEVMIDHDRRRGRAAPLRRAARGWWCRNRR